MSTDKEIYQMAMDQTGKTFSELGDDGILAALATDNAIARSGDGDPEEQGQLEKSIWLVRRDYGLLPDNEDEEIEKTVRLLRRRAGLNEQAEPYRFRIKGFTTEAVVWAESRTEAILHAKAQFGENSVLSASKRE